MKRLLLSALNCALLIVHCSLAFAQSPQSFSFQAVVRDGSGDLFTSSPVGMRISLLQGSASGTAVYVETHTPITNANGLASVQVGGGSVVSGTFASIDWAVGPYYIKSETDPNGGMSYTIIGTQQLLSVPYAMYAATSGSSAAGDNLGNHTATDNLKLNGNKAIVFGGNNTNTPAVTPEAQLVLDGAHNDGFNVGTKLLIRGIDNETDQKAISVVDENANELFHVKSLPATTGQSYFKGNVGIGTTTPGAMLEVAGQVKITGGSPGTGKVLTSDAAGLASWADSSPAMPDGQDEGNTPYWDGTTWVLNSSNIFNNGGNVGIGTSSPQGVFHVKTESLDTQEDQSNAGAGGAHININEGIWQSFTPGVTGQLTRLTVRGNSPSFATSYTLYIRQGQGSGGTIISTTSGWNWPHSASIEWKSLDIPSLPTLTAGQQYTWHLVYGGPTSGLIGYTSSDSYAGGRSSSSGGWDLVFTTHMKVLNTYPSLVVKENKVGVGTASPSARVHVAGNIRVDDGTAATGRVLTAVDATGTATWSAAGLLSNGSAAGNTIYWNGTAWVNSSNIYNNGGNVGVGTSSPSAQLDVATTFSAEYGILDQGYQNNNDVIAAVNSGMWQSFTAGVTGTLSRVDVRGAASSGSPTFTVNIYAGQGTGGSLLTTVAGWNWGTSTSSAWRGVDIPGNVAITSGQVYTFQLVPTAGSAGIGISLSNPYAGGRGNVAPNDDWNFGVYVANVTGNRSTFSVVDGKVGIRNANPSTQLDINGQIKISGGSPGLGKVLVSDANGLASWSSAFSSLQNGSAAGNTPFWNGSSWVANSSNIFNNGGNIGIGTSSPLKKLHLLTSTNTDGLMIQNTLGEGTGTANIYLTGYADVVAGVSRPAVRISATDDGAYSANLTFSTKAPGADANNLTERMRISSGGNVGIGTGIPIQNLDVNGKMNVANGVIQRGGAAITATSDLGLYSRVTGNYMRFVTTEGNIQFYTKSGTEGIGESAGLRMSIASSGNVGIGQDGGDDRLHVAGRVRAEGYATRTGTGGSYGGSYYNFNWTGSQLHAWIDGTFIGAGVTSDRRLKDRINPLTDNAIDRVMALRPVDFYYKKVEGTIFTGRDVQQEGFIADELQAVIPSAVNGEKDGMTEDGKIQPQTVNVTPIISVLTKAVQEQQDIINSLLERIAVLEQRSK